MLQNNQPIRLILYFFLIAIFSTACSNNNQQNTLNGKKLIEQKCSSCHNLNLPPKTFEDEVAPPMMAVSFHIINFIETNDESQRVLKAVNFVKDYVINPDKSKSFCDKESLKSYGLMPSQKGKVTILELDAIAKYMFEHFTQENLNEAQKIENRLKAMPKGERLALKNNCLTCHKVDKDLVGPSFNRIANLYKKNPKAIDMSIRKGSIKKYKTSKGAMMPAFKNLSNEDITIIRKWILHIVTQ